MNMHKRIRLTPIDRQKIGDFYRKGQWRVTQLAKHFRVSRPTIYKVLKQARSQRFTPHESSNHRFQSIQYGLKRLSKIEHFIQERLKREAKRYNKSYPGEMIHVDTKRLPLLKGQKVTDQREYMFVAIDDFSRELYASIQPDKTQDSAAHFLSVVEKTCPYQIEVIYSDNGTEYKGNEQHAFVKLCKKLKINQKFTRVARPQTNGKAERVIRTLMEMRHSQQTFTDPTDRKEKFNRFINFYNTVKSHRALKNKTPFEILQSYFSTTM